MGLIQVRTPLFNPIDIAMTLLIEESFSIRKLIELILPEREEFLARWLGFFPCLVIRMFRGTWEA